jgi:CDP-4-dehydro-6-deoxyglucose reductase/3-phenylpropionate/trans-cinnamate dioxygenase ferredoxin reductase subunit
MTFQVNLVDSGITFACGVQDNLIDAAMRAGWELPYSCRSGACGSCEGNIVAGNYVSAGRTGDSSVQSGPAQRVKLCRVKPCSDLVIQPREVRRLDPNAHKTIKAKVYRITRPATDVAILKLRFPAGVRAKFKAGQYLKVLLEGGEERCFSMANAPHESDGVELHVRYLPGGLFAEQLFNTLGAGDFVNVRLPFGDFYLRDGSAPIIFLAGGTGFAPVKSIIEDLVHKGVRRPMRLYFGARTPELLYMNDLCERWARELSEFTYLPVVSEAAPDWTGRVGLVHRAVLEDVATLAGCQVYACGAPPMIAAARADFEQIGQLEPSAFFCDAFSPSSEAGLAPQPPAECTVAT